MNFERAERANPKEPRRRVAVARRDRVADARSKPVGGRSAPDARSTSTVPPAWSLWPPRELGELCSEELHVVCDIVERLIDGGFAGPASSVIEELVRLEVSSSIQIRLDALERAAKRAGG